MIGDRIPVPFSLRSTSTFSAVTMPTWYFLRLPAGRPPTIAYLNKLSTSAMSRNRLPELPEGAQMALVAK